MDETNTVSNILTSNTGTFSYGEKKNSLLAVIDQDNERLTGVNAKNCFNDLVLQDVTTSSDTVLAYVPVIFLRTR